ncbi:DUF551 domain-containing protein [Methylomonas rosea]|uniref:DUF551 domain-containing protein n=1 Tax=Methylomonas rosea TaxID=2952227 RepID=A0ABT1TQ10_9GAMM|nr:DUF551 domain-containing protein [Methylomonas sp. WSC-7]MCQ8116118.1 DUF551 domain-containing protein [Methylomonas sp. WSC-7]
MIVLEAIEWLDVNESLPDDEMTVLLYHRAMCEPVWLGYCLGEGWFTADGEPLPDGVVTHWAEMPAGPEDALEVIEEPSAEPPSHTDAERYQYLRQRPLDAIENGGVFAGMTPENIVLNGKDLDFEIDCAMAQEI